MSKTFVKELDELVKASILTPEKAQEISAYYNTQDSAKPNRLPVVVNVIGALLASLGFMLLIAHNWDDLGRFARTIVGFLPLLIAQGLCAYTLLKHKENIAWRETGAVLLFFAVAFCIAIIGQTYHLDGTLTGFLFTWMLLTVPLIHIMPSTAVAFLYIAGITWYACAVGYGSFYHREMPFYYIVLLLLVLPFYVRQYIYKPHTNAFTLLSWMLVLSVLIVLGCFALRDDDLFAPGWIFTGYIGLFCVFYLIGGFAMFEKKRLFSNPFLLMGILGILFILFWWSFYWIWDDEFSAHYLNPQVLIINNSPFLYITVITFLITAWLILAGYRKEKKIVFDPTALSGFVLLLLFLTMSKTPQIGMLLINLWILFVAIFFIRKGAFRDHLGILNFGLIIIALLACFRFFDGQISFVWRGLIFLAAGVGFFVANYIFMKKRKALENK